MGQYHILVNFTKKEFVDPYEFGNGAKLWEQVGWKNAFSNVTHFLIAKCSGRGGGDFGSEMAGRWGGDRISLVGDYSEREDFPFLTEDEYNTMMFDVWNQTPYKYRQKRNARGHFTSEREQIELPIKMTGAYTDISKELAEVIEEEFEVKFTGTDWKEVRNNRRRTA